VTTYPNLELRDYQLPAWKAFHKLIDSGYAGMKRLAMVWPRRGGKDTVSLQMGASAALQRVANYVHFMPLQVSVRKHMWRGINREGLRIIDVAFPKAIRKKVYEGEMLIELRNGSTWQFGGSDNADSLVGGNPAGIIMSELAISNPMAVSLVRPILVENGGWLIAPYTPRGKTFGFEFFNQCEADPNSWAELLTCDDTGHMSAEALALEKLELSTELFEQEYYCSWSYGSEGAVYARGLTEAEDEGRITAVPWLPEVPCFAVFDIGHRDAMAMWVLQVTQASQPRVIHYHEQRHTQPDYWDKYIRELDMNIGELWHPHDADHVRHGMPDTVINQYRKLGYKVRMLPIESSITQGITRGRNMMRKALFDRDGTVTGRGMLGAYSYEFVEKSQTWGTSPVHNYASHGADSWRYMAQGIALGFAETQAMWGPAPDYTELNRAAI